MPRARFRIPSFEARRAREARKLEPVEFAPVRRNPLKPQTKVHMQHSVGGKFESGKRWELIAGQEYWLDSDKADEFIIKGYAQGNLSRNYSDDEKAEMTSSVHRITFDEEGISG